jgi:HSP20 family protein
MKKSTEIETADVNETAASAQRTAGARRDERDDAAGIAGSSLRQPAPAEVDALIDRMEQLYETVTGQQPPPPDPPYAPIPIETEPMRVVEQSLDQLLAALTGVAPAAPPPVTAIPWTPAVTVWEGPQALIVGLDVPGVERDDIQIAIDGDTLLVTGRMSPRRETPRLRASERPLGPFQRRLVLPPALRGRAKELTAELRDGRLELRFEKSGGEPIGRQTIPIR